MHIAQHTRISILFIKEAVFRLALHGFSVPQMVISHDIVSSVTKILCKLIISSDIFHHTVADLKDGPGPFLPVSTRSYGSLYFRPSMGNKTRLSCYSLPVI